MGNSMLCYDPVSAGHRPVVSQVLPNLGRHIRTAGVALIAAARIKQGSQVIHHDSQYLLLGLTQATLGDLLLDLIQATMGNLLLGLIEAIFEYCVLGLIHATLGDFPQEKCLKDRLLRDAPGIVGLICADGHDHHWDAMVDRFIVGVDAAVVQEYARCGVPEDVIQRRYPGHNMQVVAACDADAGFLAL